MTNQTIDLVKQLEVSANLVSLAVDDNSGNDPDPWSIWIDIGGEG